MKYLTEAQSIGRHEAAHAVVAHVLGLDVEEIFLVSKEDRAYGDTANGHCRIGPSPGRRLERTAMLWGGYVYDRLYQCRKGNDDDRGIARMGAGSDFWHIRVSGPTWIEFLQSYRTARAIVTKHSRAIARLGDRLATDQMILSYELGKFFSRSRIRPVPAV